MKPGTQKILELTETRVRTLQALASELRDSFGALTKLDIQAIQEHTRRQQELVDQIRGLDWQAAKLHTEAAGIDDDAAPAIRAVAIGLVRIQNEVRQLNRIQSQLLKGWRRSITPLLSLAGIYPAPSGRQTGMIEARG